MASIVQNQGKKKDDEGDTQRKKSDDRKSKSVAEREALKRLQESLAGENFQPVDQIDCTIVS